MASVTFKGNPVSLEGEEVKVGQAAPGFKVQKTDMSDYTPAIRLFHEPRKKGAE